MAMDRYVTRRLRVFAWVYAGLWGAMALAGGACYVVGRLDHTTVNFGRSLVRENPLSASAHSFLGSALEEAHRPQEAANEYASALALDPGNWAAALHLAAIDARRGQVAEARRLWYGVAADCPDRSLREQALRALRSFPSGDST